MIDISQTRITVIPQSEEGRIFAAGYEGSLCDIGTFKSRTDSTTAITIEEEFQMTCEVKNDKG